MADRELSVRISADTSAYEQAMRRLSTSTSSFGTAARQAGQSSDSAAQGVGGFVRKAAAIVGVGAAVKSTTTVFAGFQQNLNQLQAVSGATGTQMEQVTTKARELGKAVAGMSSTDAVQAMLELAKGGLTVDQSMQAATGTLNLAAAAQISAADAATIQSNALNTFRLSADKANEVADILANTANAASGEITDFAQGLSQAGTPAAQLGISLQDTATALGLFANNGVKGSDAGTALKSMLIALQKPSDQAQAALDQLGVTAFDAQGNFVGLEAISGQLAAAQKTLTVEQFNMAAATAFGTDAVRAAGILATSGADGFDKLRDAVSQAGGAQTMAEANTKGLAGAIDSVKAAVEDTQIALMQGLSPALEAGTRQLAGMIPQIAQQLVPSLTVAGTAVLGLAQQALPLLVSAAEALAPAFTVTGSVLGGLVPIITPIVQGVGAVTSAFAALPTPLTTAGVALAAVLLLSRKFGTWTSSLATAGGQAGLFGRQVQMLRNQGMGSLTAGAIVAQRRLQSMVGSFRTATTAAATAGATFPRAAAGMTIMAGAAARAGRGLLAAFGGPVGLAIVGITAAIALFTGRNAEAEERTRKHAEAVDALAQSMDQATGAITDATRGQITQDFANVAGQFDALGLKAGDFAAATIKGFSDGGAALQGMREKLAAAITNYDVILANLGAGTPEIVKSFSAIADVTETELLTSIAAGGKATEQLTQKLIAAGQSPESVADGINDIRRNIENYNPALAATVSKQQELIDSQRKSAEALRTSREQWAQSAQVDLPKLTAALDMAAKPGVSLESAFKSAGLTGQDFSAVVGLMGDKAVKGADGLTYLGQASADAAGQVGQVGDATVTAGTKVDAAAEAAARWSAEWEAAKAPTRNFQSALDDTKASADQVSTAVDLMAAALLRAAGVDLTAEQKTRENNAALRGVTEAMFARRRAAEDVKRAQEDQARAITDLATAEKTLQTLQTTGLAKDETRADRDQKIADGANKVADAKRKVADATRGLQDAQLKNAGGADAEREAMTKAAESAARQASETTMAALANGNLASATKAGADALAVQRQRFVDAQVAARANGVSVADARKQAEKYADQLGLTPKRVPTLFEAQIAQAKANGAELYRVYDKTTKKWTAQFLTQGEVAAQAKAGAVVQAYSATTKTWTGQIDADTSPADAKFQALLARIRNTPIPPVYVSVQGKYVGTTGAPSTFSNRTALQADGSITQAANGLVRQAMIAKGGSNILWAEPETGWEAYIPGAPSKRRRSLQLLGETARRMGKMVIDRPTAMAHGGITGRVTAMAAGGFTAAASGVAAPQYGDVESLVRGAFDEMFSALVELRGKAKDAAAQVLSTAEALRQAQANESRIRKEQADKVREQQTTNAARLKRAEQSVKDAEKMATKSAAQRAARARAIEKAERAVQRARELNSQQLAQQLRIQTKANNAARADVNKARAANNAAKSESTATTARLRASEAVYRRETQLRRAQLMLAKNLDAYTVKIQRGADRLAGLQQKIADIRSDGSQTALGLRGGLLGSDAFQGKNITAGDLKAQLRQTKFAAVEWDKVVGQAMSKGVAVSVLDQLRKDPEGRGGMVLRGLANGSAKDVAEINQLYAQIAAVGAGTGQRYANYTGLQTQAVNAASTLRSDRAQAARIRKQLQDQGKLLGDSLVGALNGKDVSVRIDGKVFRGQAQLVVDSALRAMASKAAGRR